MNEERPPTPIETILKALTGADPDDQRVSAFARGVAIGALVGAAIAGSTIWSRRQARRAEAGPDREPGTEPSGS